MYANGEGVDRDMDQAAQWFHEACSSGDRVSCDAAKSLGR
jgi:TPR repeat protein